jgi:uncharacterized NAD-dependent epimerase/dehydratase family protein
VIVLCHELGRDTVVGLNGFAIPELEDAIELHLKLARRTNAEVRCGGVSLNTSSLNDALEARAALARYAERLGVPVADPLRPGEELDTLVMSCLK